MAEVLYAVGGVIALAFGTSVTNHVSELIFSERVDREYARYRFGYTKKFFVAAVFDVRELRRIENQVLQGSDETIMAFKSSHLSSIGQTSVASAIIAQLGMTTLQLPGLDSVHWTGPAFIIASLLFGVLSVIVACIQQQILGMLNDPDRVRLWLSNGYYSKFDGDRDDDDQDQGNPRLQASLAAMVVLRLPNAFLSYGVTCFLTGLGLYLGFAYRQDLQNTPGRNNNEAVMILFLVVATAAITEATVATLWKLSESNYTEKVLENRKGQNNSSQDEEGGNGQTQQKKGNERVDETSPLLSGGDSSDSREEEIRQALEAMAKAHEECARAERKLAQLMQRD